MTDRDPTDTEVLDWLDCQPPPVVIKIARQFRDDDQHEDANFRAAAIAAMRASGWRPGGGTADYDRWLEEAARICNHPGPSHKPWLADVRPIADALARAYREGQASRHNAEVCMDTMDEVEGDERP